MNDASMDYRCFEAGARPAPGLPDAVVTILREAHRGHVSMGNYYIERSREQPDRTWYRRDAVQETARATAIVHALRDAGHHAEADELRGKAAALNEALHAVPEDMQERMDLMDLAVPGAGA